MLTDWTKLISIDRTWCDAQLQDHFREVDDKLNLRLCTVKVSGTQILPDSIVEVLHEKLPDYVYSKQEILDLGERKATQKANRFVRWPASQQRL